MKTRVTLDNQPLEFIRNQPPEIKRALRAALHEIESGERFPIPLHDELEGFYKVRVGDYRLILKSTPHSSGPGFHAAFAELRKFVYVLFSQVIGLN